VLRGGCLRGPSLSIRGRLCPCKGARGRHEAGVQPLGCKEEENDDGEEEE